MRRVACSEETRASCPLAQSGACFEDVHHYAYEEKGYATRTERTWRELELNKVRICRTLHNAIHASGYLPEKPSREAMADEIWNGESVRSYAERERQLAMGRAVLERQLDSGGDAG